MSGQFEASPEAEADDSVHDAALLFDSILHGQGGALLSLQPQEKLDGDPVDVLKISFSDSSNYFYLVSPSDGRLRAIRSNVNGKTLMTTFADWRIVDGVRMPFKQQATGDNTSDNSLTLVQEFAVNPHLSDAIFAAPVLSRPKLFPAGVTASGWLPFEFFAGNRIFIPAQVNGVQTVVMLDSGASSSVLYQHFAESIGLKPQGQMTAEGTGGSSTLGVLNGVVLSLGDLRLSGQTMVAIDLSAVQHRLGHPLPVILGNELFQNTVVDIDSAQHRINFRDPDSFQPPNTASAVASATADGIHTVTATIEGKNATLEFDLGNASPLALFPRFWQQEGFMGDRRASTTEVGGLGGMHVSPLALIKSVSIGGANFADIPTTMEGTQSAAAKSGRLDGNLGMPMLSRFHLIVDFPHDRVLFVPPVQVSQPFQVNHAGVILLNSAAGQKVLYVAPNSPADLAGLKKGDLVTSIDGLNLADHHENADGTTSWPFGAPGTVVSLAVFDGKVIRITLEEYF
jgi:predicted aspartyl protease